MVILAEAALNHGRKFAHVHHRPVTFETHRPRDVSEAKG
jgi:hypothetical protein